jgi:hypothetical protein
VPVLDTALDPAFAIEASIVVTAVPETAAPFQITVPLTAAVEIYLLPTFVVCPAVIVKVNV